MENIPEQEETGLADELNEHLRHIPATTGQRFLNWLIDNLFMRFVLSYLTGRFLGYIIVTFFPEYAIRISYDENTWDLVLLAYGVGILNYLIYYTISEKAFRGYTIGKLLTGTRAIRDDGGELTFKDAILRSLSRLVPFEALSGFSERPWHDSWTNTKVVKSR